MLVQRNSQDTLSWLMAIVVRSKQGSFSKKILAVDSEQARCNLCGKIKLKSEFPLYPGLIASPAWCRCSSA